MLAMDRLIKELESGFMAGDLFMYQLFITQMGKGNIPNTLKGKSEVRRLKSEIQNNCL